MKIRPDQKLEILRRWDNLRREAFVAHTPIRDTLVQTLIEFKGIVCRATLYNWWRRLLASGLDGLVDGRSRVKPLDRSNDPFMRKVMTLRGRFGLCIAECHRRATWAADGAGWKQHSYRTTLRWMRRCGLVGKRRNERPAKVVRPAI